MIRAGKGGGVTRTKGEAAGRREDEAPQNHVAVEEKKRPAASMAATLLPYTRLSSAPPTRLPVCEALTMSRDTVGSHVPIA